MKNHAKTCAITNIFIVDFIKFNRFTIFPSKNKFSENSLNIFSNEEILR